ncbi:GGDEF domain-containing protein [Neptuniibacter sp.]|uniref:GGDEF domain-containing protein n=1 Tax=Neptuniibacter sp. TaxID=1962643 RepID=UPI002626A597|nr:GGDEF domain-containing protein [Neptuniibacter sp.]MCP4595606.1 diguanylate cyclase [Neptuniibacter sp.]
MRQINSVKDALFHSLYRSALISTFFALLIVALLIFLSIEKDLRQEGQYLGQLVFKELRQAMNEGASYEEVNQLIHELNNNAPDIVYSMFRSKAVRDQFGDGRALTNEIKKHLNGNNDAIHIESLENIHYFRAIRFQNECMACHQNVSVGDVAGVLDVTFPASRVRIPISEVLMGLFLVFSITMISSYIALSSDLLSHVINPLRKLEHKLKETEGHHNLNDKVELDSDLEEILSIEHSFNAQQERLHSAFKKVEEVSIYDKLTGTYNRHQLEKLMTEETSRANRKALPLTIAMIDLNGFKKVNDSLGHTAGDELLMYFCKQLTEHLRVVDKVIRYGGDEFIVLLPDCPLDGADTLFKRIEELFLNKPHTYKGQPLQPKFSIGLVSYPEEDTTNSLEDLIQIADERMYQDKLQKKTQR